MLVPVMLSPTPILAVLDMPVIMGWPDVVLAVVVKVGLRVGFELVPTGVSLTEPVSA